MAKNEKIVIPVGQISKVDKLGRIVIPSPIRKSYNLEQEDAVELITLEEGILMRKYQPGCIFCGNITDVTMFKNRKICRNCLKEITDKL